jgi:adenylate cyclase
MPFKDAPKYSHTEIERRWLVDLSAINLGSMPFREIDDLYIVNTRLRLRRMTEQGKIIFKLGKKYGKRTVLGEPITNLYLTELEYKCLCTLPGDRACKRRYTLDRGVLDVYVEPHENLTVFEVEFADEESALNFLPPRFATREITNDLRFSGAALAKQGRPTVSAIIDNA